MWLNKEITKQQARSRFLRQMVANLVKKGGTSSHSALGMTLRYTIENLEAAKCPYTLMAVPGMGYVIEVPEPGKRLPWTGICRGPGFGPHGSGDDGTPFPACCICGGLKPGSGAEHQFIDSAIGHQKGCVFHD